MGFDRSKLKTTTSDALEAQKNELAGKRQMGGGKRNYLKIETGENKFRIFPYHPNGGGKSFAEACCVVWLDAEGDKYEDGKKVEGEKEVKIRKVFNAVVHSNVVTKDLIDEYLKYAKEVAIPAFVGATGKTDLEKKIWTKMIGDSKKQQMSDDSNLKATTTWVVYASKWTGSVWGPVGLLELKASVREGLKDISGEFGAADPFSDDKDGIPIIITKAKHAEKPADWYKVKFEKVRDGKNEVYADCPLTDAQLEAWDQLEPLYKLYVNVYKQSDFYMQLDGLQRFDANLGKQFPGFTAITAEFKTLVEEIFNTIPEGESKEEGGEEDQPEPEPEPIKAATPELAKAAVDIKSIVSKPAVAITATIGMKQATPPVEQEVKPPAGDLLDGLAAIRKKMNMGK